MTEQELAGMIWGIKLRNAVHILVAMYAYVVANTITDLEMNGF